MSWPECRFEPLENPKKFEIYIALFYWIIYIFFVLLNKRLNHISWMNRIRNQTIIIWFLIFFQAI